MTRWLKVVCALVVLSLPAPLVAQDRHERTETFYFSPGHLIRMDLSAGGYRIQAGTDDKVHVRLYSRDLRALNKTRVRFTTAEDGVGELKTKDTRNVDVVISIPIRSDLRVRLFAGELSIEGIEGHKDVSMFAGEMNIDGTDPNAYRDVSASVRVGDLNGRAFNVSKDGFFRSFERTGGGTYKLRAKLAFGEINIER
jgi:hypothetical protein